MDLFEDMDEEQCAKFGDELIDLMAGHHALLAAWFKDRAVCVMYTEAGMIPLNPEDRLTLAQVESRVRPLVADEALLPMYLEVIKSAVRAARRKDRQQMQPEGWRWPEEIEYDRPDLDWTCVTRKEIGEIAHEVYREHPELRWQRVVELKSRPKGKMRWLFGEELDGVCRVQRLCQEAVRHRKRLGNMRIMKAIEGELKKLASTPGVLVQP